MRIKNFFNFVNENCCQNCDSGECSCPKPSEPWYEAEDCEYCSEESDGIAYERNFTWENDQWVCDNCGNAC